MNDRTRAIPHVALSCFAVIPSVMLAGCASTMSAISLPNPDWQGARTLAANSSIPQMVAYAGNRAKQFGDTAAGLRKDDLYGDAGLLGLAFGSASALLFAHNATAQKNWLGGLGLGAGGITAWKTRLDEKTAASSYITASNQLQCIATTAAPVERVDIAKAAGDIGKALDDLRSAMKAAQDQLSNMDAQTLATASTELTAASAALQLGADTDDSLTAASTYVFNAILKIENILASSLNGNAIDFASTLQALQKAAQQQATSSGNTKELSASTMPSLAAAAGLVKAMSTEEKAVSDLRARVQGIKSLLSQYPFATLKSDLQACIGKTT